MKLKTRIRQYLCHHEMNHMWGMCRKCGYEDPTWTPQRVMDITMMNLGIDIHPAVKSAFNNKRGS